MLAAYRTTKSIAGFELHTKKVIFDAVGDNLQYLKQMLNNEIGAELTVREPMYKTTYLMTRYCFKHRSKFEPNRFLASTTLMIRDDEEDPMLSYPTYKFVL